ncbi:MAG: DUF87 domain-containing protein [Patescibacteria group bacterium]
MMSFFLFQSPVFSTVQDVATPIITTLEDPVALLVMSLVGLGILVAGMSFGLRFWLRRRHGYGHAFDMKVLLVRVPKELRKEDNQQEKSQLQLQEAIGHMESIFSNIGSLKAQKGLMKWFVGRTDAVSFEIVVHNDKISFYVAVPARLQSFMEEQIHAQYANAQIDEVPDYNIFTPTGVILGSYQMFRRESFFPIKSYRKLESDSMNSITNALTKIDKGDGAVIQYMVRSATPSWRREGLRIAKAMQQGKKLSQVQGGLWTQLWRGTKGLSEPVKKDKPPEVYRLSPMEEEMVKGIEEKGSKAGLEVNIRVVVASKTPEKAQQYLNEILGAYGVFNIFEYGNSFQKEMPLLQGKLIRSLIFRHYDQKRDIVLNAEELASIFHFPLPQTETPKINWLLSRKAVPPSNLPTEGIMLGIAEYRGQKHEIRMKPADRRRHMYIIGKSGSGKSVFQASLIKQDIEAGHGVCVIDPHGDLADECLDYVPKERADDVIYFDPADMERPMGINMLEFDPRYPHLRTFVINEMLKIFDKLYDLKATGGPMFETYMRNAILLLMEHPESGMTLMDIPRVLADEEYRNFKLSKCTQREVYDFWTKEALKAGGEASLQNMVPYITSKLASFIYNDYMKYIIGQQTSSFNLFDAMNDKKIILLKLSKGKIGDMNAYLLGMIMIGKILNAALARGDIAQEKRVDFFLYIDEFQNFLTDSITTILSEARKYGLCLIIAHQFIGQLSQGASKDTMIRDAIFGNVGTMLAFRVGPEDSEFLVKDFGPVFSEYDLVNVEAYTANIKMLIDNTASRPFNFKPVMPARSKDTETREMMKQLSRYKYGRLRDLVEAEIQSRRESFAAGGEDATDKEEAALF